MIDMTQFIEAIDDGCEDFAGRVYDLAQFIKDAGGWSDLPACYVYPLADDTGNAYDVLPGRQSVTQTVSVLIVVRPVESDGISTYASLDALRASVRDALLGWIPDGCYDDVRFAGGQAEDIIDGDLVWEDRYVTRYLLTE